MKARLWKLSGWLGGMFVCAALCACAGSQVRKPPSDAEKARMLVDIANGALMEGDPTGALQSLEAAEKLDPSIPALHHSRALAYYAKRDHAKALASARKAVALAPTYSDARNTLGRFLMDAGKPADAIPHLEAAAADALYRDSFKADTNLGILYYRQGAYAKASERLERAIRESPLRACHAHYYRGHVKLKQGNLEEAQRSYDRAVQKSCASFADAHLALGIAYERGKQYELARKKFLDIKQTFPGTKVAEQALERLKFLP